MTDATTSSSAISFRGVDVVFGDRPERAFPMLDEGASRRDILESTGLVAAAISADFDVLEGEICVLMGLSGSGKSTLLRAANGLHRPTRGSASLRFERDGVRETVDVAACDESSLRRLRLGGAAMVFQQFALLPWRTAEDNVAFGLEIAGIDPSRRREIARRQLERVDLLSRKDAYPHELSGGMKQRVGLARALAADAPILLMDEPFSALDPLIRSRLQDDLLALQRDLKRTILFVSHDLDEAMKIGSRIAVMEEGRVAQYATPRDILFSPADEYVASFVAHANPLNVLRAEDFMTELAELPRDEQGRVMLSDGLRVALRSDGSPVSDVEGSADRRCPIRRVIELRRRIGEPVLILDDGRAIGAVRDDDIYDCLLRHGR